MTVANWKERYQAEIKQSTKIAEKINEMAIVKTRLLTDEEIEKIFGDNGNPNAIKDIII